MQNGFSNVAIHQRFGRFLRKEYRSGRYDSISGASDPAPYDARALVDGKIDTNIGTPSGQPADLLIELDASMNSGGYR